jgi:hypothetical protein
LRLVFRSRPTWFFFLRKLQPHSRAISFLSENAKLELRDSPWRDQLEPDVG